MLWKQKAEAVKEAAQEKGAAVAEAFRHVTHGDVEKAQASLAAGGVALPDALRETRGLGAVAVGALAFGAVAIGAFAIGRLSVGRLAVGDASIRRLHIGQLEVDSFDTPRLAALRARRRALFGGE
jgi:hypothetical protein